ncbi:transmembrane protein 215-like [Colossoma macropomum]|uniref:transmembrane protein 215-like n=1 Tax=Colossoma macropomum TaxID=42526 RepID=UPI0018654383|nr:transmembrane protein 215-like [Colossoma macropomum]
MRADGINPRVGMTVAFCSIFLVFGFMFAVSGTRGEALGPVPLIALGPAVFFPALVVIILALKTNGFRSWPWPWLRFQACRGRCCAQRKEKNRLGRVSPEDLEGLYSVGGSSESSSRGSVGSGKTHVGKREKVLRNLRDYCASGGLKGAPEKPVGFSALQQECVGKSVPYTLVVAHTGGGVAFRDGFIMDAALTGVPFYHGNVRWGDETIV